MLIAFSLGVSGTEGLGSPSFLRTSKHDPSGYHQHCHPGMEDLPEHSPESFHWPRGSTFL